MVELIKAGVGERKFERTPLPLLLLAHAAAEEQTELPIVLAEAGDKESE